MFYEDEIKNYFRQEDLETSFSKEFVNYQGHELMNPGIFCDLYSYMEKNNGLLISIPNNYINKKFPDYIKRDLLTIDNFDEEVQTLCDKTASLLNSALKYKNFTANPVFYNSFEEDERSFRGFYVRSDFTGCSILFTNDD